MLACSLGLLIGAVAHNTSYCERLQEKGSDRIFKKNK